MIDLLVLSPWMPAVALGLACLMLIFAFASAQADLRTRERAEDLPPPAWRHVWTLVGWVSVGCRPLMTLAYRRRTLMRLRSAGLEFAVLPEEWLAGTVLVACCAAMAGFALARVGSLPGATGALIGALVGGLLPGTSLRDRILARRRAMARQLPFLLDLMTLSVESGLNPPAAVAMAVANSPPGAMRDELARVLRDIRAGRSRHEAFRLLAERSALAGVGSFVAALSTAERQGLSLGPLLRAQAEQRRNERFLQAERRAMEAPVRLLLPLVVFIFPGTFAILLFPVAMQLLEQGLL